MAKTKVLMVDDDPVFIDAVSAVLETHFDVRTAENGDAALAAVAADAPDVILLDVMMDHISEGYDVARTIKADPKTAHIKIIMLTGVDELYKYRLVVEDSEAAPHDHYLEKPVDPDTLIEVIREYAPGE